MTDQNNWNNKSISSAELPVSAEQPNPQRWDIFCRVVDNFGDIGVCWRLARQLANEFGVTVRLWVDDLRTFSRLCPTISVTTPLQRIDSIEIGHWTDPFPLVEPADVVIEAFACELPESYVAEMARKPVAPVWINLEYLSAEEWVEECHGMPSHHPRLPLTKYFFFPGFTAKTGGLICEKGSSVSFDDVEATNNWLASRIGVPAPRKGGMTISLFCYDNAALPDLLDTWSAGEMPIRLLVTPGYAQEQVSRWFDRQLVPGQPLEKKALTAQAIPFLSQPEYDRLLRSCDLNFVRGEDSFVRAQWAGKPFVWQIYPQSEHVHLVKLEAFLSRYLTANPASDVVRSLWSAWNGGNSMETAWATYLPSREMLAEHAKEWAGQLDQVGNLADNLTRFVHQI